MTRSLLWSAASLAAPEYRRFRRTIRQHVALGPEGAAAATRQRLHHYMEYCRTYSPFWRERWPREAERFRPEEADDVLALLPVLRKDELRAHMDELRIAPEQRRPGDGWPAIRGQRSTLSGGSTGTPVRVYTDALVGERQRATHDYFYQLCGMRPGEPCFYLWGSNNELSEVRTLWKKRLSTWLRVMYTIPIYSLTPAKILAVRDALERHPRIRSAIGFASGLETIVNFAEAEGIRFRRLERIYTGGGVLHPRLRELLQKHLADEVYNTYASRDLGVMAHETPAHDGLSLSEWFNRVEVLGPDGARVGAGERGEVHVTTLNNYSCALLRVATGDTARWHPDPGGNPVPAPRILELEGRTVERLAGPNGITIDPAFVIHLLGVVIAPAWMIKFQLVQHTPTRYTLRTEAWQGAVSDEDVAALRARFAGQLEHLLASPVELQVVVMDRIPPLRSGKHQYCIREEQLAAAEPAAPQPL